MSCFFIPPIPPYYDCFFIGFVIFVSSQSYPWKVVETQAHKTWRWTIVVPLVRFPNPLVPPTYSASINQLDSRGEIKLLQFLSKENTFGLKSQLFLRKLDWLAAERSIYKHFCRWLSLVAWHLETDTKLLTTLHSCLFIPTNVATWSSIWPCGQFQDLGHCGCIFVLNLYVFASVIEFVFVAMLPGILVSDLAIKQNLDHCLNPKPLFPTFTQNLIKYEHKS